MSKAAWLYAGLIGAALTSPIAGAEIYRWTDENGQVHYSGQKPGDQQADTVNLYGGSGDPAAAQRATEAFSAARDASAQRKQDAATAASAAAADAERCAKAREVVRYFETRIPNRIFVENAGGDQARMTEQQHAEQLATARKNATELCS